MVGKCVCIWRNGLCWGVGQEGGRKGSGDVGKGKG
jgi:hypothetical protein